jgi:hypothetical protein
LDHEEKYPHCIVSRCIHHGNDDSFCIKITSELASVGASREEKMRRQEVLIDIVFFWFASVASAGCFFWVRFCIDLIILVVHVAFLVAIAYGLPGQVA